MSKTSLPPGGKNNRKSQTRVVLFTRHQPALIIVRAAAGEFSVLNMDRPTNLSNRHLSTGDLSNVTIFVCQSCILLNSNLVNLYIPRMLHLAAPIDNHSPRTRHLTNCYETDLTNWSRRSPPVPVLPSQRLSLESGEGAPRYGSPTPNATEIDRNRPPQNSGFEERSVVTGSTYVSQLKVV